MPTSRCVRSASSADEVDAGFNELFSMFATLIFVSRYTSSAGTATGCSESILFTEILLGACCSVMLVCSSLTSRGSLFVVILLLPSDRDGLGCSALFSSALPSLITTSSPMSSVLLAPVLASLVTSPVPVFWSLLVVLSHWWSFWQSLASFLASLCNFPCQRLNRCFAVAFVVPKLISEIRCSRRNPGKFSPFSRNQHGPRGRGASCRALRPTKSTPSSMCCSQRLRSSSLLSRYPPVPLAW